MDPFGVQLAALRDALGMSRHELARRSGVTASSIARIERGGRNTTLPTARVLASVLGYSLELRPAAFTHRSRDLRPCGTPAAVARHRYHGQPLCPACKRWDRERKRAARNPQPVDVPCGRPVTVGRLG